jgi:endonuclease/exonuclease/phosphatase family metal-dependent hydrolase
MTWNINGALGRNPRFDLKRVVDYVQRHAPDIVALQEVDSRRARDAGLANPFDVLRGALGTHGAHAHAISTADGDYGQALISRWPLIASSVHDLSYSEREPRRAISADIATPAGPLHVIATHLGLSLRERSRQVQILLELLGGLDRPTVVMGDFNDWLWGGSVRRTLRRVLPSCTPYRTFPAFLPLFHLDCIYLSSAIRLVRCSTDLAARSMSDHLPVIAELTSTAQRAAEGRRTRRSSSKSALRPASISKPGG